MEELGAFLFDELAMDGRAGTSKEGFLAAIERYYVNSDAGDGLAQLVDDDYAKGVFLAMSQYSSVSMGRRQPPELPLATDDELKQADQKRGTKNKIEVNKRLDSVSVESEDGRTQYFPHDDSRILLDEDLVRLKLTGSADTKLLSVSDYLILQIIAKNRQRSTPAMEIRKKSACPTQTVFSFTKTLIEKGLVVKFTAKSQGSNSNHYLYRRYLQDNDAYQALLRGKGEIAKSVDAVDDNDDDGQQEAMERAMEVNDTVLERSLNFAAYDAEDQDEDEEDEEELVDWSADDEGDGDTSTQRKSKSKSAVDLSVFGDQRSFPQMPKERQETYIRNPVLLRGRLYKLMLASEDQTVIRKGLWMRLGFEYLPTTKMKMFHGIVRRQLDQGLMAEVMLGNEAIVPALQLTDKGLAVAQEDDDARMDASQRREQAQLELQLTKAGPAYQLGIPWERQIVECIKQSKQTTSEEVASKLHHSFEAKRHVDEILASVAKESSSQNPGAALDLAWDKENATRKRLKFARYTLLSAREESTIDTPEALARLTGFHAPETSRSWTSHEDLRAALLQGDTSRATGKAKGKAKAKKGKDKEKAPSTSTRPAKAYTNPIDPATNKPRKGRPRKSDGAPAKRKATDDDAAGGESPPAKRSRGRPRKTTEVVDSNNAATGQASGSGIAGDDSIAVPPESSTPSGDHDAPMELADATEGDGEPTLESGDGRVATAGPSQGSSTSRRPAPPLAQRTISDDIVPQAAAPAAVVSSSDVATARISTTPTTATSTRQLPAAAAAKKRGEAVIALLNFCGGVLEERYFRRAYDEWIESQGLDEAQATAFKEDIGDLKDSKTRERILRLLEDEGKIKVTKTNAKRKEAANNRPADMRQTVILYTSSTDAATVTAYILRVQSEAHGGDLFVEARKARAAAKVWPRPSIKTNGSPEAVQGSSSGGDPRTSSAPAVPPQVIEGEASVLTDRSLLEVLWDDRTREQFAHSKQALRIFYGYKQGRLARLRSLHIAIMASFARDGQADDDEEDEERETTGCIDPDWLWAQAPLSLLVTVKHPVRECPELSAALKDPRTRTRPISEQSSAIKSALAAIDADSVRQFFEEQFLDWYKCMGLAETSRDDSSDEVDEGPDSRCRFELGPWQPPIYLKIPSSAGSFTKPLVTHAGQFWDFIRQRVDDHSRVLAKHLAGRDVPFFKTLRLLARALDKVTAWRGGFTILQSVANLLQRMLDDPEVRSELKKEDVRERLSYITFLPRHVLDSYLARHLGGAFAQRPYTTSATTSSNAATTTQAATSPRRSPKTQARTIKTKSRRGRKDQWDEILDTFCKDNDVEHRKEDIREALNLYRRAFVSEKDDALSLRELKKLFVGALAAFQKPATTAPPAAEEEVEEAHASKAKDRKKKRTKKKGDANDNDGDEAEKGKKGRTRSTFDWTKENMELLRDACVIIRARDAYRAKVNKNKTTNSNWRALLELEEFAGQTTANLRSKFNSLSAAVGEEAYLAQLEEDWDILWEHFRGQDTLPDEDPTKPDAFDLRTHIKFLRDNIDKNELLIDLESDGRGLPLPARLADLEGIWHLRDDRTTQEDFDDVIKAEVTLVQKQSSLLNNGFGFERSGPSISTLRHNHRLFCETVVKMVVNTDEDEYTGAAADSLVEAAGVADVALAIVRLQRDKVVRPIHQSAPGRRVAYQEAFSKLRKTIPGDLDQLAQDVKKAEHQIADEFEEGDLVVLPNRNDGHAVMLATMLVQGQVEASIDLAEMQQLRDEKLFSAKDTEDERLEFKLHLTKIEDGKAGDDDMFELSELPSISNEAISWLPFDDNWKDLQALGWQEMTEAARSGYDKGFEEQDVLHLEVALEAAGPLGIRVETLRSPSALALARYVLKSSSANRPMAFTSGYDVPRIISGTFLSHWSVKTSVLAASGDDATVSTSSLDSPYLMPRSWFDLYGRPLQEAWHMGLLQVLGHLNTRSGASRRQAVSWLRPVFDRPEACDLIWTLHEVGLVEVRIVSGEEGNLKVLAAAINRSRQEGERRLAEKVEWETTPDDQVMLVAKRGVVKAV